MKKGILQQRKGQVWIETVLYTLIGLALIGLILAFATPKINESKDRLAVEQAIEGINALDEKINAVALAPGNVRIVQFTLKRGELFIDGDKNEIRLVVRDLTKPYSEEGSTISIGRVDLLSEAQQKGSSVTLTIDYGLELTYDGGNDEKKFNPASIPYDFEVESVSAGIVNIREVSGA